LNEHDFLGEITRFISDDYIRQNLDFG